jgi:hypothetical protein
MSDVVTVERAKLELLAVQMLPADPGKGNEWRCALCKTEGPYPLKHDSKCPLHRRR